MGVGVEKVKLPSAFLLARWRPPFFFLPFFFLFFFYGYCIAVPFFCGALAFMPVGAHCAVSESIREAGEAEQHDKKLPLIAPRCIEVFVFCFFFVVVVVLVLSFTFLFFFYLY